MSSPSVTHSTPPVVSQASSHSGYLSMFHSRVSELQGTQLFPSLESAAMCESPPRSQSRFLTKNLHSNLSTSRWTLTCHWYIFLLENLLIFMFMFLSSILSLSFPVGSTRTSPCFQFYVFLSVPHESGPSFPILHAKSFINTISNMLLDNPPAPSKSPFIFKTDPDSLTHNTKILESFDFDMSKVISHFNDTEIGYGSEFRSASVLEPLLHLHPLWIHFKDYLLHGFSCLTQPTSDDDRLSCVDQAILRGNHTSAIQHHSILHVLCFKDMSMGYQLPFQPHALQHVKHGLVAPYGIVSQSTINGRGEIMPKHRLAHDQSFCYVPNVSLNSLVLDDSLPPLQCGHCVNRILHYVHALRFNDSSRIMLIAKYDVKSACRRGTLNGTLASMCLTLLGSIALMSLRLTFGGKFCPHVWCVVTEILADLANDLLSCKHWDIHRLHSPHSLNVHHPTFLDDSIPFISALPADVSVPIHPIGKVDVYVDDTITIGYYDPTTWRKLSGAVLLALHIIGRPLHANEPIDRDDFLSLSKFLGEGTLSEVKTVLGWTINTRSFLMSLSDDKFSSWSTHLKEAITLRRMSCTDLECLVGRLHHAAQIQPLSRYFLHRLRSLSCTHSSKRFIYMCNDCIEFYFVGEISTSVEPRRQCELMCLPLSLPCSDPGRLRTWFWRFLCAVWSCLEILHTYQPSESGFHQLP